MPTPWDRAAAAYAKAWEPRFVPYHLDLVRDLALHEGQKVLVVTAGPGAEVLAVARAVGPSGFVRATDASVAMIALCAERVEKADMPWVHPAVADASDASGGPWDAVLCAFGLWQIEARRATLEAWRGALSPRGKIGILAWGPSEADDPFEVLGRVLAKVEPDFDRPNSRMNADRAS